MDTIQYDNLSLFTKIKLGLKIKMLNKFAASPDEYYSITPPDEEWMKENGKQFWICPVSDENTNEISEVVEETDNEDTDEVVEIIDADINENEISSQNIENNSEQEETTWQ